MPIRLITYDEARHFLGARTVISSNFGNVLQRLRDGQSSQECRDAKRLQGIEEVRRLEMAAVIRCIDALAAHDSVRFSWAPDLRAFARRARLSDGMATVRVLYAYEPWDPQWPEKGLADAYAWLRTRDPRLKAIELENGSAAQAFRVGRSPDARRYVSGIVADAHVVLSDWVRIFNVKLAREARRAA